MNRPNWIGQILGGRYRIDEIVGQGGMSAVYKAYDPNLRRVVAIKMIHSHLADDPLFLRRFEEEATAVAQLRHPNIVQVYDFNHDEDLYYMVQEFVPGETLQERLRRLNRAGRRMSLADAVRYTLNICDAAGYAHRRGMIHRDIKPANIMLDVQDQAILMDFGIVKITGGERHTATGAVVGTAQYLPPELIRGEYADPRSDIYSLGVTLFEMVNGRPPFESDSAMSLMMMHVNDPVPDLRTLRPEVPEELITVIERSLEKERSRRYSTMEEMGAALRTLPSPAVSGTVTTKQEMKTEIEAPPGVRSQASTWQVPGDEVRSERPPQPASPAYGAAYGSAAAAGSANIPIPAQELPVAQASSGEVAMPPGRKGMPRLAWIAAAGVLLLIGAVAVFALTRAGGGGKQASELPTQTQAPAGIMPAAVPATSTVTPTSTVTATLEPSLTPTDTQIPTPTLSPTPTIPAGRLYSQIKNITIDEQGRYIVDYETFEYTEQYNSQHVHFFFNTVPPEQAGYPNDALWFVWGGPRPFDGFLVSDRPEFATQMCIRVANPDHTIQPDSGNCFLLPDVTVATPVMELNCLAGPGERYPAVASLTPAQPALVLGISADESWWNVANPLDTEKNCWLPQALTLFNGDISTLPLVEAPPLPPGPTVEIVSISVNEQGRYVIEYVTHEYTEHLPGTHMHFFFNTVSPDQVGASGAGFRLMFGGPTPFTGYAASDRPDGATQMCVLVANPDHSIILGSGNCVDLPGNP